MAHAQPHAVDQVFKRWDPSWRVNPMQIVGHPALKQAPFVDIQNVADYCNTGRGEKVKRNPPRIGRCFSPWRTSFLFWHEPLKDLGIAYKLALVLQMPPTADCPEALISGLIFQAESKGGPYTVLSGMFSLAVPEGGLLEESDDGMQMFKMVIAGDARSSVYADGFCAIRPIAESIVGKDYVAALDLVKDVLPDWAKDSQADVQILLSAFSFAHCKNVQVAEAGRTSPPPRWTKELGVPSVKYSVVKIDTRMSKRTSGPHTDTGRHTSLHIVRGHFKHYTPEKPLLGKHVGTYWWPDNTRGDSAVGEVKKSYKVEP